MASYDLETIDSVERELTVVSVTGELDLTNAREFAMRLDALTDTPKLVLDLSRVLFIDSAALQSIFRFARKRPGGLALALEPGSPITTTVEIVELDRIVPIGSSRDEASEALA